MNVGKTKVMCSSHDAPKTKIKSSKFPCGVCELGVGANSIMCTSCKKWVHKRCSGIKGRLKTAENFICKSCTTVEEPTDPTPENINIDGD